MKSLRSMVCAALIATGPTVAFAGFGGVRYEAYPISQGVFEIVTRSGSAAQDYWCGAGDFARTQLRIPVADRIYIWKARGPSQAKPGAKGVQFSLTPPPGANTTPGYSLSVKAVGDNMSVDAAYQYCLNYDLTDF